MRFIALINTRKRVFLEWLNVRKRPKLEFVLFWSSTLYNIVANCIQNQLSCIAQIRFSQHVFAVGAHGVC